MASETCGPIEVNSGTAVLCLSSMKGRASTVSLGFLLRSQHQCIAALLRKAAGGRRDGLSIMKTYVKGPLEACF